MEMIKKIVRKVSFITKRREIIRGIAAVIAVTMFTTSGTPVLFAMQKTYDDVPYFTQAIIDEATDLASNPTGWPKYHGGNKFLRMHGHNAGTGNPRVMKQINMSEYNNLTVEFDVRKSAEAYDFRVLMLSDMTSKEPANLYSLPTFWIGGTDETWTTVKLSFDISDTQVTVTSYEKMTGDNIWIKGTTKNFTYNTVIVNNQLALCFCAPYAKGDENRVTYLDNVKITTKQLGTVETIFSSDFQSTEYLAVEKRLSLAESGWDGDSQQATNGFMALSSEGDGQGLGYAPNDYDAEKCTNALYYLVLAAHYDENAKATDGTLCKDAAKGLVEFFLKGGNEPMASPGCYWGHAVMSSAFLLIKNTSVIYNALSQDTKDRMDWMMKALAVAGNWGYNDANEYTTGLDLHGNYGKTWNMNYQNTYLSVVLNSSLYFGRQTLSSVYTDFDYDIFMDKFREYGFINVIYAWETAGKALMETGVTENGGNPILVGSYKGQTNGSQTGDSGGSGKGVKIPFRYTLSTTGETITLQDTDFANKLFTYLITRTYSLTVKSASGNSGDADYTYIMGGYTSPYEGRLGMFSELASSDAKGKRSCMVYPYDSFEILTTVYANMKLFGGWNSSTDEMQKLDERILVGNEDFIFRCEKGYVGYAHGGSTEEHEWTFEYRGILFVKDIWKNFHCGLNQDVSIRQDPNGTVETPIARPMKPILRVNTKLWDEFIDFTEMSGTYYVDKETVVIVVTGDDAKSTKLQYCVTTMPLSESEVKVHSRWEDALNGVASFKLEPSQDTYVYVKTTDSFGDVKYVSGHIVLGSDASVSEGLSTGTKEEVLFEADFEETENETTLLTEGWNYTAQSSNAQYALNYLADIADRGRVLELKGSRDITCSARVMKEIDFTDLEQVIVQFDAKVTDESRPLEIGTNPSVENAGSDTTVDNARKIRLDQVFWMSGTTTEWVTVKIQFNRTDEGITANAYTLIGDKWETSTVVDNVTVGDDNVLKLYFHGSQAVYASSVYVDNVMIFTTKEITVEKKVHLSTDFEDVKTINTANGEQLDLFGEGWTTNSHISGAKNGYLWIENIDGSKVLRFYGHEKGTGNPRVMKQVDLSSCNQLTIEFDIKKQDAVAPDFAIGVCTDMESQWGNVNPTFWKGGTAEDWTTVRLMFNIKGDKVQVTAFTKVRGDDNWLQESTEEYDYNTVAPDNQLALCFVEAGAKGEVKQVAYLDNVFIYTAHVYENGICTCGDKRVLATEKGHSLTLDGNIGMNFAIEMPAATRILNQSNLSMKFTVGGHRTQEVAYDSTNVRQGYYIFTCNVPAKQMADVIAADLYQDDIKLKSFTYSVKEYADTILESENMDSTEGEVYFTADFENTEYLSELGRLNLHEEGWSDDSNYSHATNGDMGIDTVDGSRILRFYGKNVGTGNPRVMKQIDMREYGRVIVEFDVKKEDAVAPDFSVGVCTDMQSQWGNANPIFWQGGIADVWTTVRLVLDVNGDMVRMTPFTKTRGYSTWTEGDVQEYAYDTVVTESLLSLCFIEAGAKGNDKKVAYLDNVKISVTRRGQYTKEIPLIKAMLDYGSYAQQYFGYNVENLANGGNPLGDTSITSVTADTIAELYDANTFKKGSNDITLVAASLILESQTKLRFYLDVSNLDSSRFTVKYINNETEKDVVRTGEQNGKYYIEPADILPQDLTKNVTVKISSGDDSTTVTYNCMAYAHSVLLSEKTSQELKNVVCALYLYSMAASCYAG